jgi:hypothetical protein
MGIQFEIHFDFGELDVLGSDTARCCAARAVHLRCVKWLPPEDWDRWRETGVKPAKGQTARRRSSTARIYTPSLRARAVISRLVVSHGNHGIQLRSIGNLQMATIDELDGAATGELSEAPAHRLGRNANICADITASHGQM